MKKIILFLFVVSVLVTSCSQKQTNYENRVVIAGKIEGLEEGRIAAIVNFEATKGTIQPDGSFVLKAEMYEPAYIVVSMEDAYFYLYLSPGDSIYATGDITDLHRSLKFSGSKVVENTYLQQKEIIHFESGLYPLEELVPLGKEKYFLVKDSILKAIYAEFERLYDSKKVDPVFLEVENGFFEYYDIYLDFIYLSIYQTDNEIYDLSVIDFPIQKAHERMLSLDYNKPIMLIQPYFRFLLDTRISEAITEMRKLDSLTARNPESRLIFIFRAADSLFVSPEIKDFLKFEVLSLRLGARSPEMLNEYVDIFLSESQNPNYIQEVNSLLNRWESITEGKAVPDFIFTDIEGNQVRLSNFLGKLVYMDVWATWCGPCIAEHPYWNKLKEEYAGKKIEFVTISIDSKKEQWLSMISEKGMTGNHWYVEEAWDADMINHFMIRSIPRFILIDKEGKIISASALRPSGEIRTVLDKHLAEN